MKKHLITGFVVVCLCVVISTVFAKKQSYEGVQWEYGTYVWRWEFSPNKQSPIAEWRTSAGCFTNSSVTDKDVKDVWRRAGFDFGDYKAISQIHWFDFLGSQGWELISVDLRKVDIGIMDAPRNTYWFKRPKR